MARFSGSDQVYATIGQTLAAMVRAGGVGADFSSLDTDIALDLSNPTAPLTLHLRPDGQSSVDFGASADAPIRIAMSCDVADQLLLGDLNPYSAVSAGAIAVSGPIAPLMGVLRAMLFAVPPVYRAVTADGSVLSTADGGTG